VAFMSGFVGETRSMPVTRVAVGVLLTFALLGFYLQISFGLPFSLHYLSGLLLFVTLIPRANDLWFASTICLLSLASIFWFIFSPSLAGYLPEQLTSYVQLVLAITSSIGVFRSLQMVGRLNPAGLSRTALWIFVLMSLGIALEVAGPLRPVSDAIRGAIYDFGLYSNDTRDIGSYGWIRPKLFTSEPSHLGKFYGLCLFMAVACSPKLRFQVWLLLISLPFIILVRSPAVLPGLMCTCALVTLRIGPRRILLNPFILVMLVVFCGFFVYEIVETIRTRLIQTMDPSLYIRLVRPFQLVLRTIEARPLLGYGIGSDRQIAGLFEEISTSANAPVYLRREIGTTNRAWGASHFALFIQLGAIGGLIWITAIARFVRSVLEGYMSIFWLFFVSFGFFIGVINTPFYWGQLAIFLSGLWLADQYRKKEPV